MKKEILDGCTAAAHVAYALSDVATIYPITPVASMGETAQKWGMSGRLNLMGQRLEVREMESELGAAGAVHGALAAGSLATTFTASQGLMLMVPNMYKIAGELLPAVFHVGCRSLATHALSIFGDHQDVMACRTTGFTMLASSSVQETMDLALVAHLAAIDGSLPVLHFFDGWRTSSEMDTIDVIDYETMRPLVNWDKVADFHRRAMNPEHPTLRGSAQNPDVYFQNREAANGYYDAFPGIMQSAMDRVAKAIGRQYHLVDYYGAPDADRVIVIMGSAADVVSETVDYLNKECGYKTGVIKVRLYRPFPVEALRQALPPTVKTIAALDRTKEPGAQHEPLCLDVKSALFDFVPQGVPIKVIGGRYGLSSKEFDPQMVKAIFDEMAKDEPKETFTIGINDDVTHLSLDIKDSFITPDAKNTYQTILYGIGNDGTVGGTKQVAAILGNTPGIYAQAYFSYSAKKSGGYTISQLRIGKSPITSAYSIQNADYVGCHKASYVKRFSMLDKIKEGGIFVLNSPWTPDQMIKNIPLEMRKLMAQRKVKFYNIDADAIAAKVGLLPRINMPMETVLLYLSNIQPYSQTYPALQDKIRQTYIHEGGEVVNRNLKAISMAVDALKEIDYNNIEGWTTSEAVNTDVTPKFPDKNVADFITKIHTPCIKGNGNSIPVSALSPDGVMSMGTTAYEHRRIATSVPVWDASKCIQCTHCSLVCPHAAIRPYVIDKTESANLPEGISTAKSYGTPELEGYRYRIQNYPEDCLGCASCSLICPGHALTMTPFEEVIDKEKANLTWLKENVSSKNHLMPAVSVKGTQLQTPGLEFSGACAGCGETPYVKLLTQLFGSRLLIANATGCSSIWGANFPSNAYCCVDGTSGPAWGNSLFEDNAEYGFGMLVSVRHRRNRVASMVKNMIESDKTLPFLKGPLQAWYEAKDDPELSAVMANELLATLKPMRNTSSEYASLLEESDMLAYKSVWTIGGDGWAYDIDFGGLDHVLASGEPVKILVMDTECYSNTGGQTSKATPRSCVAKYSPEGKPTAKKLLGRMMMTYGNVYVASIALGANYQQAVDALREAERYDGPAIVIAYCPCINHGIRPGLGHSIVEERRAVEAGYWQLYRYNPEVAANGGNPLTIDHAVPGPDNSGHNGSSSETESETFKSKEPVADTLQYTNEEDRYIDLEIISPSRAARLRPLLQQDCDEENDTLKSISKS